MSKTYFRVVLNTLLCTLIGHMTWNILSQWLLVFITGTYLRFPSTKLVALVGRCTISRHFSICKFIGDAINKFCLTPHLCKNYYLNLIPLQAFLKLTITYLNALLHPLQSNGATLAGLMIGNFIPNVIIFKCSTNMLC